MKKFLKTSVITFVIIVIVYLIFFSTTTPYIRGIVIDKETKKPVENAWIMAVGGTKTLTIAGDVFSYHLITRPHTRTGKDGTFSIPPRMYFSFLPPFTFGMYKSELKIDIYAPGGKRAFVELIDKKRATNSPITQDEETIIRAWPIVKKVFVSLQVPVKSVFMTQEQTKEELGYLTRFCDNGRYYFARPFVKGGCDSFEVDYVIDEHLKVMGSIAPPQSLDQITFYSGALASLGYLYEKKGEYQKALHYFSAVRDFDKRHDVDINLHIYETHIKEIKEKLIIK